MNEFKEFVTITGSFIRDVGFPCFIAAFMLWKIQPSMDALRLEISDLVQHLKTITHR